MVSSCELRSTFLVNQRTGSHIKTVAGPIICNWKLMSILDTAPFSMILTVAHKRIWSYSERFRVPLKGVSLKEVWLGENRKHGKR